MSEPHRWFVWSRCLLGLASVVVVVTAVVVGVARIDLDTSVSSFLPTGDPHLAAWERTQAAFGADPIVVLLETEQPGSLLEADLVATLNLEGRLAQLENVQAVYGPATTANQTAQRAQELLAQISGRRDGMRELARQEALDAGSDPEAAERAADEAVIAFDQRYLRLLGGGLDAGLPTLRNPEFVRMLFHDEAGEVRAEMRWLLPSSRHASILIRPLANLDQSEVATLVEHIRAMVDETTSNVDGWSATVAGAPVVTAALADQLWRELPRAIGLGLSAMAIALAIGYRVPWRRRFVPLLVACGATAITAAAVGWSGVSWSLGALAFLPIMFGVAPDIAIYAVRHGGGRTVVAAAGASAAAFGTLAISPIPFVRILALTLAAGVLVSGVLGVMLARLRPAGAPIEARVTTNSRRLRPQGLGRGLVAGVVVVVGAAGWAVLPSMPLEARPQALAAGLPATADIAAVEEVMGVSGEVSIRVDAPDVRTPTFHTWFQEVDATVTTRFGDRLRPVVTPARLLRFLGEAPTPAQVVAGLDVLPAYVIDAVVAPDGTSAVAHFGLALGDLGEQRLLLEQLRHALPEVPVGGEVEITGLPVVAATGSEAIGERRVLTNLSGILAAVAVFALALQRRRQAVVVAAVCLTAFGWTLLTFQAFGVTLSPITITFGGLVAAVGGEYAVIGPRTRAMRGRRLGPVEAAAITSIAVFLTLTASQLAVLRQLGVVLAVAVAMAYAMSRVLGWVTELEPSPDVAPKGEALRRPRRDPAEVLR